MSSPTMLDSSAAGASKAMRAPRGEAGRGIACDLFVDPHFASLDQRLEPGARQSDAPGRRRLAQEPVEPLAGVLLADVESLLTVGRGERSERRRFNRNGWRLNLFALDLLTPGALLGL